MPKTTHHSDASNELTLPAFGLIEPARVLATDDLFAVVSDKFPVSPGHTLIIPRRPLTSFRELSAPEKVRLLELVGWTQERLRQMLTPPPEAFNLGVNDGKAAGQTMPQFHFHVIPRHSGDIPDPRGGVRWVIPRKAKYW
jgi:diadenosine tetraphosphate (Ap4A) HIT family hydrolase